MTQIPKIIWTYWNDIDSSGVANSNSSNVPDLVTTCISSWKHHNPDHDVRILNDNTIDTFLPVGSVQKLKYLKHNNRIERYTDFLRIFLLYVHGGIWVDATTLMFHSLAWVHDASAKKKADFVGYYIKTKTTRNEFPIVENWFMAAPKKSSFIEAWFKEFFIRFNTFKTIREYVDNVAKTTDLQYLGLDEYFTMHIAAQYIMQKKKYNIVLRVAEDGPFKYLVSTGWDSKKSLELLCTDPSVRADIVKFRGVERKTIQENPHLECVLKLELHLRPSGK